MMKPIQKTMADIGNSLSVLDPMNRIEYLIDIGRKAEGLPDSEKTDENKVYGCASATWVTVEEKNDAVTVQSDSEAAIVKGLLVLLQRSFNGHTKNEILQVDGQTVLNTIGLGGSITNQRMNGFASAIKQIQTRLAKST